MFHVRWRGLANCSWHNWIPQGFGFRVSKGSQQISLHQEKMSAGWTWLNSEFPWFFQSPRVSVMYCSMAVWPSSWLGVTLNSPPRTEVPEMFGAVDQSVHSTTPVMFQPVKKHPTPVVFLRQTRSIMLHHVASCCIMLHVVWHRKHGLHLGKRFKEIPFRNPEVLNPIHRCWIQRSSPGFYSSQGLRLRGWW